MLKRTHQTTIPIAWPASLEEPGLTTWLTTLAAPVQVFLSETIQRESEAPGVTCRTTVDLDTVSDTLQNADIDQEGDRPVRLRVTLEVTQTWASDDGSCGGWDRDQFDLFAEPAADGQATCLYLEEDI